jgi:hypothetical protein
MAYQSGEVTVPGLSNIKYPTAVANYNNTLFLLGGDSTRNGRMMQTTFALSNLPTNDTPPQIDTGALTTGSNWVTGDMSLENDDAPYTLSRCAMAATPEALYGFWHYFIGGTYGGPYNSTSDLRASVYTGSWGHSLRLLEMDGQTAPVPYMYVYGSVDDYAVTDFADVSATSVGSFIIYTCAQATSATNSDGGIYLAIYDTNKIDATNNTWTAEWHTYISLGQMSFYSAPAAGGQQSPETISFDGTGPGISIDWFSTVVNNDLSFYLAISFLPTASGYGTVNTTGYIIYLPLTVPDSGAPTIDVSSVTCNTTNDPQGNPSFAAPIVRDPAGRLRAYFLQNLSAGYFMTTSAPAAGSGLLLSAEVDTFTIAGGDNVLPSALFYIFLPGASETTVTLTQQTQQSFQATEYPVFEFVFYNSVTCQLNLTGTIQVLPNFRACSPVPKSAPASVSNVIAGIIDGPIPLPLQNYQNVTESEDQGDVTYGTTDTQTASREVSTTSTAGFETSGQFTKGFGPAWDISLNSGMGRVSGSTLQTSLSYSLPQPSYVDPNPASVRPYGAIRGVTAQFNVTAYRFLDPNGNPVSDATTADLGQAPKLATVLTTFPQYSTLTYTPYAVTPGDLHSYTPEHWNKKMAKLGYTETTNYYGNVICANAYPFQGAASPYLDFSWNEGISGSGGFNAFTSTYTEQSWTFNSSYYGGVSGGGGFSVFGLSEELEAEFLGGGTYSHESDQQESSETSWGINLSETWGPTQLPTSDDSVVRYDFRLFFLPVPTPPQLPTNYWAQELKDYMPAGGDTPASSIDPNSGCWRIVFVVTTIIYKDSTQYPSYNYDGNLDKVSVYQAGGPTTEET